MGARRRIFVGAVAVAFGAGAATLVANGRPDVAVPDEGPWIVVVSFDPTTYRPCVKDPAVGSDTTNASAPSTGGAMTIKLESTRSDVERVLRCVTRYVPHSKVKVGKLSVTARPVLPVLPPAPGP